MKVLVTGAGGMVGRNFQACDLFADWDLLCPRRAELDLSEANQTQRYLERNQPDLIVHCAARVGGIEANRRDNAGFLHDNALINLNLLHVARTVGVPRLLNLGSSCMYPKNRHTPLKIEDLLTGALEPTNEGYAIAKILGWEHARLISQEDPQLSYKTLIPCNLYGPWDKFDSLNAHLIPSAIRKAQEAKASGQREIEIWGDGSARREFLFVEDLLRLIHLCVTRWEEVPLTLNGGFGRDFTVLEYYEKVCEAVGLEPTFRFAVERPMGMTRKLLDSTEAFALGYAPQVSHAEGIERTLRYFRELKQ